MKIGIYIIKCTVNNKIYIGSSENIEQRFKNHKSMLINNKHHSIHLQRAFNKYGIKSFKKGILEECSSTVLIERENYYLNTLLKSNEYVNGTSDYFIKNSFNILPIAIKGYSGTHTRETILKISKSRGFDKIFQIDIKGNIIKEYEMITDAVNDLNINLGTIVRSLKNKTLLKSKNYGFIKKSEYYKGIEFKKFKPWNKGKELPTNKGTVLYVYDIYGRFYKKFNTIKSAAEYFNTTSAAICKKLNIERSQLTGKSRIIYYNFYNEIQDKKFQVIHFDEIYNMFLHNLEVYTVFDEFIGYTNVAGAALTLNTTVYNIQMVLDNKRNQCKKYKFKKINKNNDIV